VWQDTEFIDAGRISFPPRNPEIFVGTKLGKVLNTEGGQAMVRHHNKYLVFSMSFASTKTCRSWRDMKLIFENMFNKCISIIADEY